jgi:hypothetical protein
VGFRAWLVRGLKQGRIWSRVPDRQRDSPGRPLRGRLGESLSRTDTTVIQGRFQYRVNLSVDGVLKWSLGCPHIVSAETPNLLSSMPPKHPMPPLYRPQFYSHSHFLQHLKSHTPIGTCGKYLRSQASHSPSSYTHSTYILPSALTIKPQIHRSSQQDLSR